MHQTDRSIPRGVVPRATAPSLLVAASVAAVLCGCAPGEDVMTTAVPQGTVAGAPSRPMLPPPGRGQSGNFTVTPEQRAYLDALNKAGVDPSSDLMALSIGSYICQAHAAGQSDQAVRDFVLPLVRGDLHDAHPDVAVTSMATQVDDVTAAYMRIATDRLC